MDPAKFHRTLYAVEPNTNQLKLYNAFKDDGKLGFDNSNRDLGEFIAVFIIALSMTEQKHKVVLSCPNSAKAETEEDVRQFLRSAFRKLKGNKGAVKAILEAMKLIGILDLTQAGYGSKPTLPKKPTIRWVSYRHNGKGSNSPKWLKAALLI